MGDLYVWCADLELLANDDPGKARQLLDKARTLKYLDKAAYHSTNGFVLWLAGERERAIAELEESVALNPTIRHLAQLGKVLSTDGDGRAPGVWRRVLQRDPKNCQAHIYLGIEAAKSGDRGQALLMAKRAERLSLSALDSFEIGRLYQEISEFQNAIVRYMDADRLGYEPKGPLYASIAACYFSLGDNEDGRRYLQWATKFDADNEYVKEVQKTSRRLGERGSKGDRAD